MTKICLIYNFAQHYRTNIFTLMDNEFSIDFVFGNSYLDVKKMDYFLLKGFKKEVTNHVFFVRPFSFQKGVLSFFFKKYDSFLMLGDLYCVSTWLMLFFAKLHPHKKIYLWSHGWYGREGRIKSIIKKMFFRLSNGTFLYGDYARKLMIESGLNPQKLHVIYNSLAYDKQMIYRSKLRQSSVYREKFLNNNKNLIFIGRLASNKKLEMIISALVNLNKRNDKFNLTFIGTGESEPILKSITKANGLEKQIWFYGSCFDEEIISNLIYNADLCISPGNVGLTAIHSLSYGTPVITHNNYSLQMPEFEAIKPWQTGLFFEYDNIVSLVDQIQNWFSKNLDRDSIRQACYDEIDEKWNPYYQISVFKEVFK